MKWSIQELFLDLIYYYNVTIGRWYHMYKIWKWPLCIWRQAKVFFYWLFTGIGYTSTWDVDSFLAKIIIFRIDKLIAAHKKAYAKGYSLGLSYKYFEDNLHLVEKEEDDNKTDYVYLLTPYYINDLEKIRNGFNAYIHLGDIEMFDVLEWDKKMRLKYKDKIEAKMKETGKDYFNETEIYDAEDIDKAKHEIEAYDLKIKQAHEEFDEAMRLFSKYFTTFNT